MSKSSKNSGQKSRQTTLKPDPISNPDNTLTSAGDTKGSEQQSKSESEKSSDNSSSKSGAARKGKVIEPDGPATSRRKEMETYSDAELRDLYFNTFAREADENLSKEQLINLIDVNAIAAPNVVGEKKEEDARKATAAASKKGEHVFKSSATGKEFKMSGDLSGHVVVRQVNIQQLNSGMVEVPNTETVQTYRKELFDQMVEDKFFSESKLKIEILQEA